MVQRSDIVLIDGGLFTALEDQGVDVSGPLWTARSVLECPEELLLAHIRFAAAGAQYVTTASYQCGPDEYMSCWLSQAEARAALASTTSIARRAVEGTPARVAASVGPYGACLADGSEYRGDYRHSWRAVRDYHQRKLDVLVESAPDVLAVETQPLAAEVHLIASLLLERGSPPAWFSCCFRDESTTCGGDSIDEVIDAVAEYPNVLAVGVNCTAPRFVTGIIERLRARVLDSGIIVYPNHGGHWDGRHRIWTGSSDHVFDDAMLGAWLRAGATMVGGCCGVGPADISRLARWLNRHRSLDSDTSGRITDFRE